MILNDVKLDQFISSN
jgi:hypothetical protein